MGHIPSPEHISWYHRSIRRIRSGIMENKVGRALRRGVALGLTLAAAWTLSLTADLTGVGGRLAALGEDPALAASLMASQLG